MFSTGFYKNFIFLVFSRVMHMFIYNKERKSFIHKLSTFSTFKKVIHILWITCGKLFGILWISTLFFWNPLENQGIFPCRYVYRDFVHKIDKLISTAGAAFFINCYQQPVHKPTFFSIYPHCCPNLRKLIPKRNIKGFMFLTLSPVPV